MNDIYAGIDPKTGENYTTEYNPITSDPSGVQNDAENSIDKTSMAEVQASGKSVYIPKLEDVTFKISDGQKYTYAYSNPYSDNIMSQSWHVQGNSQNPLLDLALISPPGKGN